MSVQLDKAMLATLLRSGAWGRPVVSNLLLHLLLRLLLQGHMLRMYREVGWRCIPSRVDRQRSHFEKGRNPLPWDPLSMRRSRLPRLVVAAVTNNNSRRPVCIACSPETCVSLEGWVPI